MTDRLEAVIDAAWESRETVTPGSADVREAVESVLNLLDSGEARVAEPDGAGGWRINQWLKKAVLLSFRLYDNAVVDGGAAGAPAFDKVPSKFAGWGENRFRDAGFRVVPGAVARRGSFIGRNAVLMPSFVNIGAYVGEGTMVDTWATVGSCAQIGRNVHISGGAGIGGVLEPLQAGPVIIGDGAFIGARAEVAEGVRVGEGAVDVRLSRRFDQDRRSSDRRSSSWRSPALCGGRPRRAARQAAARRHARPLAVLRGDREDRRRANPLQDRNKRAAAGLISGAAKRNIRPA
jgi:2,3,4,5-tetrahydropyridine-2-carboxylate N-succinyltransferase